MAAEDFDTWDLRLRGGALVSLPYRNRMLTIAIVLLAFLVCFPVGLLLTWSHPTWSTRTKVLVSLAFLVYVGGVMAVRA